MARRLGVLLAASAARAVRGLKTFPGTADGGAVNGDAVKEFRFVERWPESQSIVAHLPAWVQPPHATGAGYEFVYPTHTVLLEYNDNDGNTWKFENNEAVRLQMAWEELLLLANHGEPAEDDKGFVTYKVESLAKLQPLMTSEDIIRTCQDALEETPEFESIWFINVRFEAAKCAFWPLKEFICSPRSKMRPHVFHDSGRGDLPALPLYPLRWELTELSRMLNHIVLPDYPFALNESGEFASTTANEKKMKLYLMDDRQLLMPYAFQTRVSLGREEKRIVYGRLSSEYDYDDTSWLAAPVPDDHDVSDLPAVFWERHEEESEGEFFLFRRWDLRTKIKDPELHPLRATVHGFPQRKRTGRKVRKGPKGRLVSRKSSVSKGKMLYKRKKFTARHTRPIGA